MLARLRRATDSDVRRVVGLLDRDVAGLEQEVLLLPVLEWVETVLEESR